MSSGQREQSCLGGEKDFHARSVDGKHRFKISEQCRIGRCEKVDGLGVGEHENNLDSVCIGDS